MFRHTDLIIFKLSMDCNLECDYCLMHNKIKNGIIEFETFTKIIDEIIKQRILQKNTSNTLKLVFHGGEILMVKVDYLDKMLTYATEAFKNNKCKVSFGTQSNITLLTDEYAKIFKKHKINVGVSFDGPGNLSDFRILNFDFKEKLEILKKHELAINFIITVSKKNIFHIDEILSYLASMGFYNVKINYVEDVDIATVKESLFEVTGEEYYQNVFLTDMHNLFNNKKIVNNKIPLILKRAISDMFTYQKFDGKTGCETKYCGGGMYMVTIGIDGTAYICDRYDKEYPHAFVKNIGEYDFLGMRQLNVAIQDNYKKYLVYKEMGCNDCEAKCICDHGCIAMHYTKFKKYGIEEDMTCVYFKSVYAYIKENIKRILPYYKCIEGENTFLALKPQAVSELKNYFMFKLDNNSLYIKEVE